MAPITVGSGTSAPRIRTESGTRNGRSSAGFEKRSLTTASCAAVNATRTPKLNRLARKPTGFDVASEAIRSRIEIVAAATTVSGEWRLRRLRRAKRRGSWPCSPIDKARRPKPEFDVAAATSRMRAPVSPTYMRSARSTQKATWGPSA
jgi:hypothetical protein